MKFVILFVCVALAAADVSHLGSKTDESRAEILEQSQDIYPDGSSRSNYQTSNGISASSEGELKDVGGETPSQVIVGEFSYTDPNGIPTVIKYVADENGYQPQGDVIPTPPPIPAAIVRSLEYIRAHQPQPQEVV